MSERTANIAISVVRRLVAVGAAVAVWWALTNHVWSTNPVISKLGPEETLPSLLSHLTDGNGIADIRTSLGRLLAGLIIAMIVGVPLGVLLGLKPGIESATSPIVNFMRMISPLAWAPVVIVALGVGNRPVIFLIGVTAVWPIALGTAAGVRQVLPAWYAVAQSLGANKSEAIRFVTVPAVRTNVLTSLRLALGVAWIVLVPAEMLGVDSGLGYSVLNARDQLDYALLGATVLLIGIIGFVLDSTFRRVFAGSAAQ